MPHKWPILKFKQVDSTNNYARVLIEQNKLTVETVINAMFQQKGRGQQDNSWESEPGKNLTFTLVLFSNYLKAGKQFFLSQAVSLGITDFLKLYKIISHIKWPNDIYAGENKIAGILIENSILNDTLVNSLIGIGVNVNQQNFSSGLRNVQSMKSLTSRDYNLNELLDQLLMCLDKQIERLKRNEFVNLKKDYIAKLYKFGKRVQFSTRGNLFFGKIIDVDDTGQLVILNDKGEKLEFMFKEVAFVNNINE